MVDHPVIFRGLDVDEATGKLLPGEMGRPALVERTDKAFLAAFLDELGSEGGRRLLATQRVSAKRRGGALKLFQPVHRAHYLALFEVACDTFGEPRLDPARIDSAGLVVRRVGAGGGLEGWMRRDGKVRGWLPFHDGRRADRDPDPARRPDPYPAGHPEVNRRLARELGAPDPCEESVSLLFLAPPHVCAAAGRTLLYGLVPVASAEVVDTEPGGAPRYSLDEIRGLLSPHFQPSSGVSLGNAAKRTFRYADLDVAEPDPDLKKLVSLLRLLVSVFDAFERPAMLAALDGVMLPYADGSSRPAGQALKAAAEVFVQGRRDRSVEMPKAWPAISAKQAAAITSAAKAASDDRLGDLLPRQARFDRGGARYQIQGLVRVRRHDGCPPALHWSAPSEPFEIAGWFERGKLPPVLVALPAVSKDNIKHFLPNVAFSVPGGIFNLVRDNSPKDLLDGKGKKGKGDDGLTWICGFNIPIITICAFIVLNIFLQLLNIIFFWLPFIKICFPIPGAAKDKLPSGSAP